VNIFNDFGRESDIAAPPEDIVQFFRDKAKGESNMKQFWNLVRESIIAQGFVTTCFVATTCYLWATGQAVPQELWTADTIVLGFFFGAKAQQISSRSK
jgi:hypothetical protein